MNLQIRHPRARELARQLAEKRKLTMTEAVIEALEAELERERQRVPLAERLGTLARDARHRDIEIVLRRQVSARSFPEWKMRRFEVQISTSLSAAATSRLTSSRRASQACTPSNRWITITLNS